jgi:hypothetical protein
MNAATMKQRGPHVNYIRPVSTSLCIGLELLTAVTVSMHRTKGSEVRYRESERAYSFHSCPNRS